MSKINAKLALIALRKASNPTKAKLLQRFFKTGPGQYAEGDQFLGITVPVTRSIAKAFFTLPLEEVQTLLQSPLHEARLLALVILTHQFKQAERPEQTRIHRLYLSNTRYINNWDLVDTSAGYLVGSYLDKEPISVIKRTLLQLASSRLLWERRIAMIATFHWIMAGNPTYTLLIAEKLLNDKHDLIHKAVGWMLREVGKRCSEEVLKEFLVQHTGHIPRTALRYAIERFSESERKRYLALK